MDKLKSIQDNSVKCSMPGIDYTQGDLSNKKRDKEKFQDSADNDYAPDSVVGLLQLDYILPEDELEYTSQQSQICESHLVTDISEPGNAVENKTDASNDSTENKQVEMICRQMHTKKTVHIKIKNKKSDVDGISCDPYNIEENIDLIVAQDEIKSSVDKPEKMVTSDAVECLSQISSTSSSEVLDKIPKNKNSLINNGVEIFAKGFSKTTERTQLLSSEMADELLKAVIYFEKKTQNNPNICLCCKFESNSVEERIEHLKSEKHKAGFSKIDLEKKHDPNSCPLCGFYSESLQERIEHLQGSRHTGAQEIKKAIICGILENYTTNTFYCTVCSWFVTDIEPLIEHILSNRHHNAELMSLYKKYNLIKTDFRGQMICIVCKCILISESGSDEIYDHLMNHKNKCYYFNFCEKGCHYNSCGGPHECGICGGEHPQIKCYLYNGRIPPREYKSQFLFLKTFEDIISYSPENDKNKYESHQRGDRSRSPVIMYGSRSPSHIKYDSISYSKSHIGRDQIKEHVTKSPLNQLLFTDIKQTKNSHSSISLSNKDSDDEDEEFNIITTIVKLLRICYLLGDLGYFFADTLNKALEIKESTDDVLAILREPANIILMEVILKKLKSYEKSVNDSRVCKKFIKGIMYLTYLIDESKSSQLCDSSQDFSYVINSLPPPSVR